MKAIVCALVFVSAPVFAGEPQIHRAAHYAVFGRKPMYGQDAKSFGFTSDRARKGGEFRQGVDGSFDSINPLTLTGTPGVGVDVLVYESLLMPSLDEEGVFYGRLAAEVSYPDDLSWVAFRLHPAARFQDGTPVTANDVAFSYELLVKEGHPRFRMDLQFVDSVSVSPDGAEVRFQFKLPNQHSLPVQIGRMPVLCRAYMNGKDLQAGQLIPMGSGPYRLGPYQLGSYVSFERDPNYWASGLWQAKNRHNFDRVRWTYYRDHDAHFNAFKTGRETYFVNERAKEWHQAYDFRAYNDGKIARYEANDLSLTERYGIYFNTRRRHLQDRKVRQALSLVFDFEWMNDAFFFGDYKRMHSFFQGTSLGATDVPDARESRMLIEANRLSDGLNPAALNGPAVKPPVIRDHWLDMRERLKEARDLLIQAGYRIPPGKFEMENARGELLRVELLTHISGMERILLAYQRALVKLGVHATVRRVETIEFTARQASFDYDLVVGFPGWQFPAGEDLTAQFSSKAAGQKGSKNLSGIRDRGVDLLINAVTGARSWEDYVTATSALDRVLRAEYIFLPFWYNDTHRVTYWKSAYEHPERSPLRSSLIVDSWWAKSAPETESATASEK